MNIMIIIVKQMILMSSLDIIGWMGNAFIMIRLNVSDDDYLGTITGLIVRSYMLCKILSFGLHLIIRSNGFFAVSLCSSLIHCPSLLWTMK